MALFAWDGIMQRHEGLIGRGAGLEGSKVDTLERKEKERGPVHPRAHQKNSICKKFRVGRSSVRSCGKYKEGPLSGTTSPPWLKSHYCIVLVSDHFFPE